LLCARFIDITVPAGLPPQGANLTVKLTDGRQLLVPIPPGCPVGQLVRVPVPPAPVAAPPPVHSATVTRVGEHA